MAEPRGKCRRGARLAWDSVFQRHSRSYREEPKADDADFYQRQQILVIHREGNTPDPVPLTGCLTNYPFHRYRQA